MIEVRRHTPSTPWTYADLDRRQEAIHQKLRHSPDSEGAVLLSEVSPVITTGKRPCPEDLLLSAEHLKALGIDLYSCERGGRATYHGPGQWVIFVVDRLERLTGDRRGVRKAVEGLLDVALQLGKSRDSRAEIRDGAETGVWLPEGKFASVGVKIRDGILLHGLSINGFKTSLSFQGLRPCGLDLPVSFLLDSEEKFEQLGEQLLKEIRQKFY
ncbi:MAG: hypothetical protein H7222_10025 [Methylotenera sp.]|nr:hypothetical protein [Oligoflexia bacterium]